MTTLKLSFWVFIVCICKLIHLTQIYLLFQLFCKYHLTLNHIHKNNPVFHRQYLQKIARCSYRLLTFWNYMSSQKAHLLLSYGYH